MSKKKKENQEAFQSQEKIQAETKYFSTHKQLIDSQMSVKTVF